MNYIKQFMEANNIVGDELFNISVEGCVALKSHYFDEHFRLRDYDGNITRMYLNGLLSGEYEVIKVKTVAINENKWDAPKTISMTYEELDKFVTDRIKLGIANHKNDRITLL